MSQKKVREYDAKRILSRWLHDYSENEHSASGHIVRVSSEDVARTSQNNCLENHVPVPASVNAGVRLVHRR